MRNILIVAASAISLFMSLSGQPKSEARSAGFPPIEDSSLQNHQEYQRWKKALVATRACRELLGKWAERSFTVHIKMASSASEAMGGAETKDYVFDGAGNLTEATIALEPEFAKVAPRNAAAYPILSSLNGHNISREGRAVGFLAHELFGHVEHARTVGGAVFQRQNKLLSESEAGYTKYGWDWFQRREYKRIVDELGARPFDIVRGREISADAAAIPVLQEYFGKNMPANVREAIQSYESLSKTSLHR